MFGKAVINKCCEKNCKLGLEGIFNYVVMKGEKVTRQKICDCIIVHDASPPRIILVELKSGGVRFEQVIEKFTNGLHLMLQFDRAIFGNRRYNVNMLLLVKRRLPRTFYSRIRSHKFKLRGEKYSIMTLRCGEDLVDMYKKLA